MALYGRKSMNAESRMLLPTQKLTLEMVQHILFVCPLNHGLTLRQLEILLHLKRAHDMRDYRQRIPRKMAMILGLSEPVVGRALDTLGRIGFILRRNDVHNQRIVVVDLQPDGIAFLNAIS